MRRRGWDSLSGAILPLECQGEELQQSADSCKRSSSGSDRVLESCKEAPNDESQQGRNQQECSDLNEHSSRGLRGDESYSHQRESRSLATCKQWWHGRCYNSQCRFAHVEPSASRERSRSLRRERRHRRGQGRRRRQIPEERRSGQRSQSSETRQSPHRNFCQQQNPDAGVLESVSHRSGSGFPITLYSRGKMDCGPPWGQECLALSLRVQGLYQPESVRYCDHSGQHRAIRHWLKQHRKFGPLMDETTAAAGRARDQGQSDVCIEFVCNHGRHRSVAFAEEAAQLLQDQGFAVSVAHLSCARWHNPKCRAGTCGRCRGA